MAGEGDLVFGAKIDIELGNSLKQITGELQKVGLAAEKEVAKGLASGVDKGGKGLQTQWSNIAKQFISSTFNPLVTAQETRAGTMPGLLGGGANLMMKFIPVFNALPDKIKEAVSSSVEAITRGAFMKSKYVYTGAREEVSGQVAMMARLGFMPKEDDIRQMMIQAKTAKSREFEGRKVATRIAEEEFGGELGEELARMPAIVGKGMRSLKAQLDDLLGVMRNVTMSMVGFGETVKSVNKSKGGED